MTLIFASSVCYNTFKILCAPLVKSPGKKKANLSRNMFTIAPSCSFLEKKRQNEDKIFLII